MRQPTHANDFQGARVIPYSGIHLGQRPAQWWPYPLRCAVTAGWGGAARGGHALRLEVELDQNLPRIEGDATQLRQVLHNLLANARDAVADQGEAGVVRVTTALAQARRADGSEQPAVRLTVSDSGPGFSPQVLQRACEPYVTTKPHGTGLGLAIVRKIVDEHGGRMDIANRREGGARVSILLTRLAAPAHGLDLAAQENDNSATQ